MASPLELLRTNSGWKTPARLVGRVAQQRLGRNAPLFATLFVTKRCNVRCDGCVYYENQDDNVPKQHEDTERAIALMDRLADGGVPVVSLVGGEPFLRKDLDVLLRHGRDRGLSMTLVTNGMIANRAAVLAAEQCCDQVVFSPHPVSELAGPRARAEQRWEDAWRGFAELRTHLSRSKLLVGITVGRHTAPMLEELLQRSLDGGADGVRYHPNFFPEHFPTPEEIAETRDLLARWTATHPGWLNDPSTFLDAWPEYFGERPKIACTANRRFSLGVFLDGTVSACCAEFVPMGNLLEQPLQAMLSAHLDPKPDCFGCHRVEVVKALELCGDRE